ncbi:MAG: phosphotransferase family protein [Turicibacter sp.]|nr:phosphotransferase family protein [Turicibacter sp.]
MESIIKSVTAKALGVSTEVVMIDYRLMGGMSNLMYVIDVEGEKYTFRIPGKNAEVFVDREEELANIRIVDELGINNKTIYFDTKTGYKISKFVEGTPLSDVKEPESHLEDVAKVLHTLHESGLKAQDDYRPYDRLNKYEKLVSDFGYKHAKEYFELKDAFFSQREYLDQFPKVICHGDSQISNLLIAKNQTYLLDWEYAGNNDPLYDVACVGNKDFDLALKFLPIYLGRKAKPEEYRRLYLWRAFQCLQWHNVALYKEMIGLSQDLGIDFNMIASNYLTKAAQFLEGAKEYK